MNQWLIPEKTMGIWVYGKIKKLGNLRISFFVFRPDRKHVSIHFFVLFYSYVSNDCQNFLIEWNILVENPMYCNGLIPDQYRKLFAL